MAGILKPPSAFPQELVDETIDYLQDNAQALSACCLVCNAWLPRARRYLFRTIFITPRNCATLLPCLDSPPCHTLEYVRVLMATDSWISPGLDVDDIESILSQETLEKVVYGVAGHTLLESLYLHTSHPVALPAMASFSQVTDLTLKLAPTGRAVHAAGLICAFPQLRRLALHLPVDIRMPVGVSVAHDLSPHLHTIALHLGPHPHLLLLWLAVQRCRALRALRVHAADMDPRRAAQPLQFLLDRLTAPLDALTTDAPVFAHLSALPTCIYSFLDPLPDLAHARPRAATLVFASPLPVPVLAALPTCISALAAAVRVTLDFALLAYDLVAALDVPALDGALVALPALRDVVIVLSGPHDAGREAELKEMFARCAARGMLEVTWPEASGA